MNDDWTVNYVSIDGYPLAAELSALLHEADIETLGKSLAKALGPVNTDRLIDVLIDTFEPDNLPSKRGES